MYELIGILAGVVVIVGGLYRLIVWLRGRSKAKRRSVIADLWDTEIGVIDVNGKEAIVARLAVAAKSLQEASDRAKFLLEQWNHVRLGFSWPLDQDPPNDDEGKPLGIVRLDLLPQVDGEQVRMYAVARLRSADQN